MRASFAVGGAMIGVGMQAMRDYAAGETSSIGAYTGAAVSGGIAGWGLLSQGLKSAVGYSAGAAAGGNGVQQVLDDLLGNRIDYNLGELGIATAVGGTVGAALYPAQITIPYSRYAKGLMTKLANGTISQVSAKTAAKIFGTKIVEENFVVGNIVEDMAQETATHLYNWMSSLPKK